MTYISNSTYMKETLQVMNSARLAAIPSILWGPPGTGKTELIKSLGAIEDVPVVILLGSIMDPTDLSGLPALETRVDEDGETYQVTKNTVPDWADLLIRKKKGILFLDEFNNSTPTVQSAFLSLLQGRKVGQHTLPDEVWIIAASNEEKDAADGYTLAPPTANRLLHLEWQPTLEDWFEGMLQNWGDPNASDDLRNWRFNIVSFLKAFPDLLQKQPEDETKAGKAWPSRRTWDAASKTLASSEELNQKMGQKITQNARRMALKGLVGEAATVQYFAWEAELNLPTHEQVLATYETIKWSELKADVALTILSRVPYFLNEENVVASIKVLTSALQEDSGVRDMTATLMRQFLETMNERGLKNIAKESGALKELTLHLANFTGKAKMGAVQR